MKRVKCQKCGTWVANTWKGQFSHLVKAHPEQFALVLVRVSVGDPYKVGQGLGEYLKGRFIGDPPR